MTDSEKIARIQQIFRSRYDGEDTLDLADALLDFLEAIYAVVYDKQTDVGERLVLERSDA